MGETTSMKLIKPGTKEFEDRLKSKGLGDTIKKVTDALHIPQCGACKRRQQKLNKMFPYKTNK